MCVAPGTVSIDFGETVIRNNLFGDTLTSMEITRLRYSQVNSSMQNGRAISFSKGANFLRFFNSFRT